MLYRYCFSNLHEYVIRGVQVNQNGLKLNGAHQFLVYGDAINILGGSLHTVKENRGFLVASKEFGLSVNTDKAKYEGWNFNSGNYLFTTDTK